MHHRRSLLKAAGAFAGLLAAGLAAPLTAFAAWSKDAFAAKKAEDALKSLGTTGAQPSKAILIEAPDIAENGAIVPIEISSSIPGTSSIAVLIDKNPYPLAAKFDFGEGAVPFVKLNAKMGETSDVRVVATAGGSHYTSTREVKVTLGGCGG